MDEKGTITNALRAVWEEGRVTAANVVYGYLIGTHLKGAGWWVTELDRPPYYLGKNVDEALAIIKMWEGE